MKYSLTWSSLFALTHCILVGSSTVICWASLLVILGVAGLFCFYSTFLWKILLANSVDPDQMPHNVASDLGLHCWLMTLLRVPGKNRLRRTCQQAIGLCGWPAVNFYEQLPI